MAIITVLAEKLFLLVYKIKLPSGVFSIFFTSSFSISTLNLSACSFILSIKSKAEILSKPG